jgi:hypothetical protein
MCRGCKRLDTSTQGEYTKSKAAYENIKDFNVSKRQPQILPLRPAFPTEDLLTGNDMAAEAGLPIAWCELATVFRSAEHLTLNQRVQGSSPCAPTISPYKPVGFSSLLKLTAAARIRVRSMSANLAVSGVGLQHPQGDRNAGLRPPRSRTQSLMTQDDPCLLYPRMCCKTRAMSGRPPKVAVKVGASRTPSSPDFAQSGRGSQVPACSAL